MKIAESGSISNFVIFNGCNFYLLINVWRIKVLYFRENMTLKQNSSYNSVVIRLKYFLYVRLHEIRQSWNFNVNHGIITSIVEF